MNYLVKVYQNNQKLNWHGSDKNRPLVLQFVTKTNEPKKIVKKVEANKDINGCTATVRITVEQLELKEGEHYRFFWEVDFYKITSFCKGFIEQFEDGTFQILNDQGVSDEDLDSYQDQVENSNVKPIKMASEKKDLNLLIEFDQSKDESNEQYQERLMKIVAENDGPDFRKKAK